MKILFMALTCVLFLNSCVTKAKKVKVVKPFYLEKYLGKWYEIARMDFRFEHDLNNVTAMYTVNMDGTIKVDNRGYNYKTKEWKQSYGKAKFVGEPDEARLKVSFFGPFYSAYKVIAIDNDYKYALVAGKNMTYLWFLSRETTMPEEIKDKYLKFVQTLGYNTSALIWTEHNDTK